MYTYWEEVREEVDYKDAPESKIITIDITDNFLSIKTFRMWENFVRSLVYKKCIGFQRCNISEN